MIDTEELKNLVYALTLAVRKPKRELWVKKGFKRVNRKKDFLLNYWSCRLAKNNRGDLELYARILKDYNAVMLKAHTQITQTEKKSETVTTEEKKQILATPAQMLTSAGAAAAKWIKGGLKTLSEEKVQKRLDICKGCEFWDSAALKGTGRCRKCGCATWAKIRMPAERCPENKWLAETV